MARRYIPRLAGMFCRECLDALHHNADGVYGRPAFMDYHPRYLRGVEHFNAREFFEAHEVWEDHWKDSRGAVREFYKGLIQVAVALHHFGNGNMHGAKKLYHSSRAYLAPYRPMHIGLDLESFLGDVDRCFKDVANLPMSAPPVALRDDLIPTIALSPAPDA